MSRLCLRGVASVSQTERQMTGLDAVVCVGAELYPRYRQERECPASRYTCAHSEKAQLGGECRTQPWSGRQELLEVRRLLPPSAISRA